MVDEDIVRADPRFRRQALWLLAGAAALFAAGIRWGLPWLDAARHRRARRVVRTKLRGDRVAAHGARPGVAGPGRLHRGSALAQAGSASARVGVRRPSSLRASVPRAGRTPGDRPRRSWFPPPASR